MKNSPLQLEEHVVTSVHLDANLKVEPAEQVEWRVHSTVNTARHKTDERRWKVDLTVKFAASDEAKSPYHGSVSFSGLFRVADDYPKEKVHFLVETNAPSILYGAARETVANLSARGPWPMVLLPTQSFYPAQPKPGETVASPKAAAKQA